MIKNTGYVSSDGFQNSKPKLLLICALGPRVHVALRYFETVNGVEDNHHPYHVQEYLDGHWLTLSKHHKFENAVGAFEARIAPIEAVIGSRALPQFSSKWTTLYLPEPAFGYQMTADGLVRRWLQMAA